MDTEIKKYVDAHDIKTLKYIFADALDIDPTFDRYQEEYEYCKVKGILEPYIELTPFQSNKANWDEEYWLSLKEDLQENFSEKRMMHMCEVAEIVRAEKIQRLRKERAVRERAAKQKQQLEKQRQEIEKKKKTLEWTEKERKKANEDDLLQAGKYTKENNILSSDNERKISKSEEQKRQLEKDRKEIEEHNKAVERTEAENRKANRNNLTQANECTTGNNNSKKVIGIAVAVILVVIVILLLVK